MSTSAVWENETIVVAPGGEATATLTVHNGTDIVEAYEFEVVGRCSPWTVVEPARLSLYPGTRGSVTLVLRPPRSPEVPAGEVPLAVRVTPVERPELVAVPETTVHVEPFQQLRAWLAPQRRRAWRTGRFHVVLHNQGNTPIDVPLEPGDAAEELRFRLEESRPRVEPDEQVEVRLRARAAKLIWFGAPARTPFVVTASPVAVHDAVTAPAGAGAFPATGFEAYPEQLDGELHQLPILPKWLLALLALLLALLIAWFALLKPTLESAAKEAAEERAQEMARNGELAPAPQPQPEPPPPAEEPGGDQQDRPPGTVPPGSNTVPGGGQFSTTIRVATNGGEAGAQPYIVPEGKVFYITDLVLANSQGDEGVLTIWFGGRMVTTIALETFRNQDYHWVTPIEVPAGGRVVGEVNCALPGTPPSGQRAPRCVEVLNVSGVLRDLPR
ncbi:hydrolytic protein [Saccharopolyspora gregorii]|uniref:COG1470 family protein n=1 Tax=Saccharopolyspora gregorii TaxID=33914 RepID=UPI0031E544AC